MAHRRPPSLRRLLAILLGVLALLVGGLILIASLQVRGVNEQTRAENRRTTSFLVADSVRQSSNDLTNMVRLYVASGEPRYRDYYDEILAIRNGTARRPRDYDSSFWDRVLAGGRGFVRYGPPQSLVSQMRAAKFAPAEFRALQASLDASNGLAELERDVMARVARRIARGVDAALLRRRPRRLPAAHRRRLPALQGPDHAGDQPLHRARRRAHDARGRARARPQRRALGDPDRQPPGDRPRRRRRRS